ncbi:N-acetylmuramoyl-L-alanine amidase [Celeribacter indicus]|uniref:N-acetylmuramoyl-L-alanine amidase n=1 Tax=Celeribacter indicus TaxID=1208324 RepID=A0A0B5E3H1_9RHOB|nr:N-acetylmuramoyl-L-alanine amidase [Celeribacter indicus]AJE47621.1 N-acetylmuramoyl-L-alanine amidase [Celeribacter indicus]SDW12167.1 N-acetylmuramoyl-L-alanine amidase [Celeribacter indicus]
MQFRTTFAALCLALAATVRSLLPAGAQDLTALAQADSAASALVDQGDSIAMSLRLSQPVPFRIFSLDAPRRIVVDFSEVDWTGFDTAAFDTSEAVTGLRVGGFTPGWSRMVLDLDGPYGLVHAQMARDEKGAVLSLDLDPVAPDEFALGAGTPPDARLVRRAPEEKSRPAPHRRLGDGPIRVVLDPGHGGIDPGAERDGLKEADLMLAFARDLRDVLIRAGHFEVTLTREEDVFVPLETRVTLAREAGADVLLSLHADAIAEGRAEGATVYTLAERASDVASQKLAERHDRADLLAGVDLSGTDDEIATVLMDMARTETSPRTDRFADILVKHLEAGVGMHKRPRLEAGFSVLKAPDMPSVLLELGFLSSPRDRAKLMDTAWRARAAWAIRDALLEWEQAELAARDRLRK